MAATINFENVSIRNNLRPGDIGRMVLLHGTLYAAECGFDETFEAYVAGPLAEFVLRRTARERIWLAEAGERLVGCIAIVAASAGSAVVPPASDQSREASANRFSCVAQLRWFLVHPGARGIGLGRKLLADAVAFCREQKYESIFLWTVSELTAAARLYEGAGFVKMESVPAVRWGKRVVEEKYVLDWRNL